MKFNRGEWKIDVVPAHIENFEKIIQKQIDLLEYTLKCGEKILKKGVMELERTHQTFIKHMEDIREDIENEVHLNIYEEPQRPDLSVV